MTSAVQPQSNTRPQWTTWTQLSLDSLRVPYWVVALALGVIVFAGQVIERSLSGPLSDLLDPGILAFRLALPVLTVYMLLALKTLKTSALPILADVRPAVQIDDATFDQHVRHMLHTSRRVEAILAGASLAIVIAWFFLFRLPLPLMSKTYMYLPSNLLQALVILASYVIVGWAGLSLVYSSIRFGRGLGKLTESPLAVNVFDPDNLLGFGRLSLRHSLTVAATILLLVIPLGTPTEPAEYAVLLLASMASLSVLIFPLWGVHKQMARAREVAAGRISGELAECQKHLLTAPTLDTPLLSDLTDRSDKLLSLRSTIYRSPTWPFRSMPSIVRVVLASMSPFLVFIVNEIIRTYLLPMFGVR